jgi:hypothetical protein
MIYPIGGQTETPYDAVPFGQETSRTGDRFRRNGVARIPRSSHHNVRVRVPRRGAITALQGGDRNE